jgi:hypothetical protein
MILSAWSPPVPPDPELKYTTCSTSPTVTIRGKNQAYLCGVVHEVGGTKAMKFHLTGTPGENETICYSNELEDFTGCVNYIWAVNFNDYGTSVSRKPVKVNVPVKRVANNYWYCFNSTAPIKMADGSWKDARNVC